MDLLSHTHRIKLGQLLRISLDQLDESEHWSCPLVCIQVTPLGESFLSCVDGKIHIFLQCFVHLAYHLLGDWIEDLELLAGFSSGELCGFSCRSAISTVVDH